MPSANLYYVLKFHKLLSSFLVNRKWDVSFFSYSSFVLLLLPACFTTEQSTARICQMSWHLRLGNARFRIKLAKYHGRNFLACTLKLWYLEIGKNHRQSVNIFKTFIPMGACCCQELRFRQMCRCCVLLNDKVYSSWYPWNSCEYRSFFDAENTFFNDMIFQESFLNHNLDDIELNSKFNCFSRSTRIKAGI